MGLCPELLKAVQDLGYKNPTAIQAGSIPAILQGRDVLGGSPDGNRERPPPFASASVGASQRRERRDRHPRVLVLAPTRELAQQVGESFIDYSAHLSLRTQIVFGGVNIKDPDCQPETGL